MVQFNQSPLKFKMIFSKWIIWVALAGTESVTGGVFMVHIRLVSYSLVASANTGIIVQQRILHLDQRRSSVSGNGDETRQQVHNRCRICTKQ